MHRGFAQAKERPEPLKAPYRRCRASNWMFHAASIEYVDSASQDNLTTGSAGIDYPRSMLAEWIKAARLHRKLTQEALGDAVGVSKQNVNAWEKGRHEPSFAQAVRIAQLTGYPLPEDARMAGATAARDDAPLSPGTMALARLIERIEPALQVHVEALVHALQPPGDPVRPTSVQPLPAPTLAPAPVPGTPA